MLEDKNVLIAGVGKGLGSEIAAIAAREGARFGFARGPKP